MQQYIKRNTRELEVLQKLESAKKIKSKKPTQIKNKASKTDFSAKPKEHKNDNVQKSSSTKESSQKTSEPKEFLCTLLRSLELSDFTNWSFDMATACSAVNPL